MSKFQVGDKVKITKSSEFYNDGDKWNPIDKEGIITKMVGGGLGIYVDWETTPVRIWNSYNEQDLELITQTNKTQTNMTNKNTTHMTVPERKAAVLEVAKDLCIPNNTVTTLEIKIELRKRFPNILWNKYQTNGIPGVSDLFHQLVYEGQFRSVADNGTFQTYADVNPIKGKTLQATSTGAVTPVQTGRRSAVVATKTSSRGLVKGSATALAAGKKAAATRAANKGGVVKTTGNKIGKTAAYDLMKNNKGRFFTATFTKKDGTKRTINCQFVKDQTPSVLGYVQVKEAKLLKSGDKEPIRNLNLQTLESLKVGGKVYSVK